MLQDLTIDNLAIIPHLSLEFGDHMTVLTGETGAGKSIIIDAVNLLVGGRGSQELIRRGCNKLVVQGQFTIPDSEDYRNLLQNLGIDYSDQILIISREIHRNGRNLIRVNGILVNTTVLKKIGQPLVDIQGQNESQRLLQAEEHIHMLDYYAGKSIQDLLKNYRQLFQQYQQVKTNLAERQANEQQWAQRLDMLKYQVQEIGDADLHAGEEEELTTERDRLEHFQQISQALQNIETTLNSDEPTPVLDLLADLMEQANQISDFDESYQNLAKGLSDSYYTLQDCANQASQSLDQLAFDDGRLQEINARLDLINDLERKYGDSVAEILEYYQKIQGELSQMQGDDNSADDLKDRLNELTQQLSDLSLELHQVRLQTAKKLERDVHAQLKDLYMDKAVFKVKIDQLKNFTASGQDMVEFYIQTNPGERLGPLVKIVSGGELSRVMLALKAIFARSEGVTSIIFDEVDTGVSGRVAQAIADKIKLIATSSQVLCITHLPQVAAVSEHQFKISKHLQNQRTVTEVQLLNQQDRVDELARMLAGEKITKLTREHAQELLNMAR